MLKKCRIWEYDDNGNIFKNYKFPENLQRIKNQKKFEICRKQRKHPMKKLFPEIKKFKKSVYVSDNLRILELQKLPKLKIKSTWQRVK